MKFREWKTRLNMQNLYYIFQEKNLSYLPSFELTYKISMYVLRLHSSQFQGLCLMKSSSETLQNLPYFIYVCIRKAKAAFPFFISWKNKVARNEKQKKQLWVFIYGKFIYVFCNYKNLLFFRKRRYT